MVHPFEQYYRGYNPRPPEFPRVQNGPQRNNRSQRIIFSREELFLPSISPNPYGHQELHQVNAVLFCTYTVLRSTTYGSSTSS